MLSFPPQPLPCFKCQTHIPYLTLIVCSGHRYKESDLIKLDILINGDCVEPLATIVHRDKVT
ncbi:hypothetical protein CsSME_00003026 [Camellia sinensis var. sinensis]